MAICGCPMRICVSLLSDVLRDMCFQWFRSDGNVTAGNCRERITRRMEICTFNTIGIISEAGIRGTLLVPRVDWQTIDAH
jgi:hypothetical protein